MSVGRSGRIVIEIDPLTKRSLYSALAKEGMSLKDWFLREADRYLSAQQPELHEGTMPEVSVVELRGEK